MLAAAAGCRFNKIPQSRLYSVALPPSGGA